MAELGEDLFQHWFDPKTFFEDGYPEHVSSALRIFPQLAFEIQRVVVGIAPRRALEVGPGDRPLISSVPGAVYLDIVPRFLARLSGRARVVQGDIRRPPFRPDSFDLLVLADVLTHVPPADRPGALGQVVRLARRVVLFNPEAGTPEVRSSPVPTDDLERSLRRLGLAIERRDFVAPAPGGTYRMALLHGER